jgi:phosphoglucomutase
LTINPQAGKPASPSILVNVPKLVSDYYSLVPDPSVPEQRVSFGTSGHRGSSLDRTFNERHILAVTQAICQYRSEQGVDGPLFLGADTHALSAPALATALEVLAANNVEVMISLHDEYTPTPALSHAIIKYNRMRSTGLADGIVVTPSHNPPTDGGFKYNPPTGGPADTAATSWIETKANAFMANDLAGMKRIPFEKALRAGTTHRYDYLGEYVKDLLTVIDMEPIAKTGIKLGVDPLGGASVRYWRRIAEQYGLNLTVVNEEVDSTFKFMTVDWDGKIRMDPSSPYAMQRLIGLKDRFDIAFACDTDADRHGVVTRTSGLLQPNHYLSVMVDYLFRNRPSWRPDAAVGKTLVSSAMIDRVANRLGRSLYETPVGFKWFVDGLLEGSLGFGGEESAGASFLAIDGSVWCTDKDGIIPALLSAEITAKTGRDPGQLYQSLTAEFGIPWYTRVDAPANAAQKEALKKLSPGQVTTAVLAGEKIKSILTKAPGNNAAIGGLKVITENGWFAARPSGTENIYKIYAESFKGEEHLKLILEEAQNIVSASFLPQRTTGKY